MQNTLPVRVPELFIPSCDRSVWFKPGGEGEEKQQVIMEQTRHLNWMVSYCTRVSTAPTDFCAQQFFILGCEVANINIKSHHSITKQELYLKKKKVKNACNISRAENKTCFAFSKYTSSFGNKQLVHALRIEKVDESHHKMQNY